MIRPKSCRLKDNLEKSHIHKTMKVWRSKLNKRKNSCYFKHLNLERVLALSSGMRFNDTLALTNYNSATKYHANFNRYDKRLSGFLSFFIRGAIEK